MKKKKRIPKNYVLVEVDFLRHKKVSYDSGAEIIIDYTFEPEQHALTHGVVATIPEALYFNSKDYDSLEFLTDIDVKVGDQVFFHYIQINKADRGRQLFIENGKTYIFISHDSLFCGIRNDEVVMFNGWLLLNPIAKAIETDQEAVLVRPDDKESFHPLMGEIEHIGSPVKKYWYGTETDTDSGIEVEKGDLVAFLPHSDIPLEYPMHQSLNKKYYRAQRKELLGIY